MIYHLWQLKELSQALQIISANVQVAERSAQGAQYELMERQQLMEAAKRRMSELAKRLKLAQRDLDNTKVAVMKANSAARDARVNAERSRRTL